MCKLTKLNLSFFTQQEFLDGWQCSSSQHPHYLRLFHLFAPPSLGFISQPDSLEGVPLSQAPQPCYLKNKNKKRDMVETEKKEMSKSLADSYLWLLARTMLKGSLFALRGVGISSFLFTFCFSQLLNPFKKIRVLLNENKRKKRY